jgi:hypothetical protein
MFLDPQIAVIRTDERGPAFYDTVLTRIAGRTEQPEGVLFHFSGMRGPQFLVGTAFSDRAFMQRGFMNYVAPETTGAIVDTGAAIDLERDEYELEHLHVPASVPPSPFQNVPAGGIVAHSSDHMSTRDLYWATVNKGGLFLSETPGLVAHVAFNKGEYVAVFDFWESRAIGEAWYAEKIAAAGDEVTRKLLAGAPWNEGWIDLHSFLVAAPADDPLRDFRRPQGAQMAGRSEI